MSFQSFNFPATTTPAKIVPQPVPVPGVFADQILGLVNKGTAAVPVEVLVQNLGDKNVEVGGPIAPYLAPFDYGTGIRIAPGDTFSVPSIGGDLWVVAEGGEQDVRVMFVGSPYPVRQPALETYTPGSIS